MVRAILLKQRRGKAPLLVWYAIDLIQNLGRPAWRGASCEKWRLSENICLVSRPLFPPLHTTIPSNYAGLKPEKGLDVNARTNTWLVRSYNLRGSAFLARQVKHAYSPT